MARCRQTGFHVVALMACALGPAASLYAQAPSYQPPGQPTIVRDYVVGPRDVLTITSHDDPALTGRFAVEADLTFTYPLIGRVRASGLTLREVEAELQKQLVDQGFFKDPKILVAMEPSTNPKVFVVGEVRKPGAYTMSGDMRLIDALTLSGSALPTASGEAVIVPAGTKGMVVESTRASAGGSPDPRNLNATAVTRINLSELQSGALSQNVALKGGDTVFVLRADKIYVLGQVRKPGVYPLQPDVTTVLQGLALAGGVTDRGTTSRVEIVRIVAGEHKKAYRTH